jgi:hypothetical protein
VAKGVFEFALGLDLFLPLPLALLAAGAAAAAQEADLALQVAAAAIMAEVVEGVVGGFLLLPEQRERRTPGGVEGTSKRSGQEGRGFLGGAIVVAVAVVVVLLLLYKIYMVLRFSSCLHPTRVCKQAY